MFAIVPRVTLSGRTIVPLPGMAQPGRVHYHVAMLNHDVEDAHDP
jgi:hypothetical protein